MNKIIITLIALFLGIQINSNAQGINEKDNKITSDKILEILNYELNGTGLIDFKINLKPNNEARHSLVLSKSTIYSLSIYQDEPNQFEINLFKSKSKEPIEPSSTQVKDKIISSVYPIEETGVYHLIVKNISKKQLETVTLLSFIERITEQDSEEIIKKEIKTERNVNIKEGITKEENTSVYFVVEKMPKFKDKENKIKNFNDYVEKEMKYPQEALNENIGGKVYVQFTVGKNGYVKDAKVARGVHPALDQEALRIVYSSPKWEPGTQKGEAVDVIFTFPIIFKIEDK